MFVEGVAEEVGQPGDDVGRGVRVMACVWRRLPGVREVDGLEVDERFVLDLRGLPWVEGVAVGQELRGKELLLGIRESHREAGGGPGVAVGLLGLGSCASLGLGGKEWMGRSVGEGHRGGGQGLGAAAVRREGFVIPSHVGRSEVLEGGLPLAEALEAAKAPVLEPGATGFLPPV